MVNNIINVLGFGDGWIGVEKPCGISVHNDPGEDVISIISQMIHSGQIEHLAHMKQNEIHIKPVHRIDKDTSGVILLAYKPEAIKKISNYFNQGLVQKKYFTLVHGNFESIEQEEYTWEYPLSREAGGRNNPAGNGKKIKAETRYKILKQSPHYSLLEVKLITGKKHQIRRHAKLGGHPLVCDKRYGSKKAIQFLFNNYGYNRLGLHSHSIVIPDKDLPISIFSQGIPEEIQNLLDQDENNENK